MGRNPYRNFDYNSWAEQKITERTKEALAARDAAFAEEQADTPLEALAQYLAEEAEELRHTPAPCEVDGGAFIEQRFGSWENAVRVARLQPRTGEGDLKNTLRYNQERIWQKTLFLTERAEKKRQKQIEKGLNKGRRDHEKAVKRHAKYEAEMAAQAKREAARAETTPSQAETV